MNESELATNYMNLLAVTLSIIDEYPRDISEIELQRGYSKTEKTIRNYLNSIWKEECETFIGNLTEYINNIRIDKEKYSRAFVVSKWIDEHISYLSNCKKSDAVSLWPICKLNTGQPVTVYSLNDNYVSTGIWINPRFNIRPTFDVGFSRAREASNRGSFYKFNSYLKHCCYFVYKGNRRVKNVIISQETFDEFGIDNYLSIAFSPITCKENIIESQPIPLERAGVTLEGMTCMIKPDEKEKILERTEKDWLQAGRKDVDIVFMPELLGTEESCGIGNKRIAWVNHIYKSELKKTHSPMLTVLPSYWSNYTNTATIVAMDGRVLGVQHKYEPYIRTRSRDRDGAEEALIESEKKETIIIHIPDVHRIAVLICSEFLADSRVNWSQLLCACLGVSLLIVPSYSGGEYDFINKLSTYKEYGTTVIWGNCCGACVMCTKNEQDKDKIKIMRENRSIGGYGIAGEKKTEVFGTVCECNHMCDGIETCSFVVDIPLKQDIERNNDTHRSNLRQVISKKLNAISKENTYEREY